MLMSIESLPSILLARFRSATLGVLSILIGVDGGILEEPISVDLVGSWYRKVFATAEYVEVLSRIRASFNIHKLVTVVVMQLWRLWWRGRVEWRLRSERKYNEC